MNVVTHHIPKINDGLTTGVVKLIQISLKSSSYDFISKFSMQ